MIEDIEAIKAIQVDWETESVAIVTREGVDNLDAKLDRKTVTTGCGQGTVFGDLMEDIDKIALRQPPLKQSSIYALLAALNEYNEIYKNAGAVHGCALCSEDAGIEQFIEDVGAGTTRWTPSPATCGSTMSTVTANYSTPQAA
jgi:FdhD protein